MLLKHIDQAPPLDVIKAVWDKVSAGEWTDLGLWANAFYLASWALEFLDQKIDPDKPIFGGADPVEAVFCSYCVRIHDWASDGEVVIQQSAIGAWIVKAMLLALLNRMLRELAANGIPDWLAEIIRNIKDKLEAL